MLSPSEHKRLEGYIQSMDVSRLTEAFDALSEPNRCQIFCVLLKKPHVNVGQLASVVSISESLASQHLKILRGAGLVEREKQGRSVYYRANSGDNFVQALQKVVEG